MGVMCSVLGHDYGDAEVKRERAEEGNEVVRTAKRVERCHNCDHERTVSENKEVTALSAAAGVTREPDGTVVAAPDSADGTAETGVVAEDGGAPAGRTESNGGISLERIEGTENVLDSPPAADTDGEDASEATDDATERMDDTEQTDETTENGDGPADETGSESAVEIDEIRDVEPDPPESPGRAPGEWPAEPDGTATAKSASGLGAFGSLTDSGSDWPAETDSPKPRAETPGSGTAVRSSRRGTETGSGSAAANRTGGRPASTFVCQSCGFTTAVADSPLRAGDICPECRRGYLAWETRKG